MLITLDSRSGTPNQSRKSPTTEMGVQTNENQRGEGGNKDKMQRNNNNNNNNNQRYQQRERRDSGRNEQENRGDMNRGGYRVSHADFLSQNSSNNNFFLAKSKPTYAASAASKESRYVGSSTNGTRWCTESESESESWISRRKWKNAPTSKCKQLFIFN